MLYVTYSLNALLMMGLPIALGVFLARRFKVSWGVWGVGAITFILSQVVHLPILWALTDAFKLHLLPAPPAAWALPFNAVVLGLLAGLCEEIARYLVYRFWIKRARTWREALMFGAGHGGVEAIIFGALAGLAFINMTVARSMDLTTQPLTPDQLALAQQQLAAFWSAPWYASLLGAVERVFALCLHLSLTVLVLQAFTRRNLAWLGVAIGWHAVVDGVAVYAAGMWGPYWTEAIVALFALMSLGLLFALRPKQDLELPPEPMTTLPSTAAPAIDSTGDLRRTIDETRYTG